MENTQSEKQTKLIDVVRMAWPYIKLALDRGHTIKVVHQRLMEDGFHQLSLAGFLREANAKRGERMNPKQPPASEIPDGTQPRWLTVQQLMKLLPLKRSQIYYLTHVVAIPHHKIGQTLLFREDEIRKWMEGNKAA